MDSFRAHIAGREIAYAFRFPECANYLRKILDGPSDADPSDCIFVRDEEFQVWESAGNRIDSFAEFCLLCMPTSEKLLTSDRCVFHAAAIRWNEGAWLIAGSSGVGKSTLCRTLMELEPGRITMINGDKPVLECCADGTVIVHPSPWTGKEGWHGADEAPLAGIILLKRGDEDIIIPAGEKQAAVGIYKAIFQSYRDEKMIRKAASAAEKIMKSAPVWLLNNHSIPRAAGLLLNLLKQENSKNVI